MCFRFFLLLLPAVLAGCAPLPPLQNPAHDPSSPVAAEGTTPHDSTPLTFNSETPAANQTSSSGAMPGMRMDAPAPSH